MISKEQFHWLSSEIIKDQQSSNKNGTAEQTKKLQIYCNRKMVPGIIRWGYKRFLIHEANRRLV